MRGWVGSVLTLGIRKLVMNGMVLQASPCCRRELQAGGCSLHLLLAGSSSSCFSSGISTGASYFRFGVHFRSRDGGDIRSGDMGESGTGDFRSGESGVSGTGSSTGVVAVTSFSI